MKKQLPKRSEVEQKYTWDVNSLFASETLFEKTFEELDHLVNHFKSTYEGKLDNPRMINEALDQFRTIQETMVRLSAYSSLQNSGDSTSEENQIRLGKTMIQFQSINKRIVFLDIELKNASTELLEKAMNASDSNKIYLEEIIEDKKHSFHPEVEKALTMLSPILNAPYQSYNRFKLADMKFQDFEVEGKTYPNSFTLFENEYEYENDTLVRRKAYQTFYQKLSEYQNGFASQYYAHIQKEKAFADLKGYASVYDYLLADQKVPKAFMDRQIDLIMNDLAPAMRKYAKLLQKIHGLEKMTYADLKIAVDADFEPKVTIESSKDMLLEGLSILGSEYLEIVRKSFDDRWIDFPQNVGKSTGGFCSSPYGSNSFILINWNGQMDEVMVLAHELGHAGHFQYANKYQNIYNTRPSLYFIEAPSTTNELIMNKHLAQNASDDRTKRWIKSVMISRTYYHNFVTHLLEAAFQREVYNRIDQRQPISAKILNDIKLGVLRTFWADAVEIPDWAGLTWMRQPHYFMGLYPYTYSAGLTLGTVVAKNLFDKKLDANAWIEVLKAGGTKTPLDLAMMVGVDLSHDAPLKEAIQYISETIDEIIDLSK